MHAKHGAREGSKKKIGFAKKPKILWKIIYIYQIIMNEHIINYINDQRVLVLTNRISKRMMKKIYK
jgi:hypothetical protein